MNDKSHRHSSSYRVPFTYRRESDSLEQAVIEFIGKLVASGMKDMTTPQQTLTLKHGQRWAVGQEEMPGSELERSQVTETVKTDRLIENDLQLLIEIIQGASEGLVSQFKRRMYAIASEASVESGNVVDAVQAPVAESFLEAVRTVRPRIDEDGKVRLPALHMHPEVAERVLKELRSQPERFRRKILAAQAEQKIAALEAESERLRRFFVHRDPVGGSDLNEDS